MGDDILRFWQMNESVYPTLSQVAQLYLATFVGIICAIGVYFRLKNFTMSHSYMTL